MTTTNPSQTGFTSKFYKIVKTQWNSISTKYSSSETRKSVVSKANYVIDGFETILNSLRRSFRRENRGIQGEDYLFAELFLAAMIAFGIPKVVKFCFQLIGGLLSIGGAYVALTSIWEIRHYFSLFKFPLLDSQSFITTGPYQLVRHPIYSGFFLFYLGISLIYQDIYKFIVSLCYILILVKMLNIYNFTRFHYNFLLPE